MKPYFECDGVTLYHGDCRDVLAPVDSGRLVDLVLTDPPYAISVDGSAHIGRKGRGSRRLDFFPGDSDYPAVIALWREALRCSLGHLAAHGSVYAWLGHREIGPTVDALEENGFTTRLLAWQKKCPAPPPPGAGWPSAFEVCVYGYRPGRRWTHTASNAPRTNLFLADSFRHGQPGKEDHPTQKPLSVISPIVQASSFAADCVLDPFCGSGTTLVAAWRLNRRAIGIEIEERYCEVTARRLEREMVQGRMFYPSAPKPEQIEFPALGEPREGACR